MHTCQEKYWCPVLMIFLRVLRVSSLGGEKPCGIVAILFTKKLFIMLASLADTEWLSGTDWPTYIGKLSNYNYGSVYYKYKL